MKTQFNSAAYRDGFLYGLDDGLLACLEIATGDANGKMAATAPARRCSSRTW